MTIIVTVPLAVDRVLGGTSIRRAALVDHSHNRAEDIQQACHIVPVGQLHSLGWSALPSFAHRFSRRVPFPRTLATGIG